MHTKPPTKAPATSNNETAKKEYAEFTLVIYWTHTAAKSKGVKRNTLRDDITKLQYENRRIKVAGLHPLAILEKKFLEERHSISTALFYDNKKADGQQVVWKVVFDRDRRQHEYDDLRDEYYDLSTGLPLPTPKFKQP